MYEYTYYVLNFNNVYIHKSLIINTICFIFIINNNLCVYSFCELKKYNIFKKALQTIQILSVCLNNAYHNESQEHGK